MLKVLGGLKVFLKKQEIVIDGGLFRMHTVLTTVILFTCSIIVTATQYVGNPIQCIVQGLPVRPVNTYCWIMSTFTMPDAFNKQIGTEVAHPGVYADEGEAAKKYYSYYQWVCFVLFFQGIACYAPKWIWVNWEKGLMKTLVMGMNHYIFNQQEKLNKKSTLIAYFLSHIKQHRTYALRYFICEASCMINVFIQIYGMDKFFGGQFFTYGWDVLSMSNYDERRRSDTMAFVFPTVTKCTFHKFGPTGSIQKHDALCVLPLNIVNEKTYVVIWFWFLMLFILSLVLLVYRIALICYPSLRPRILYMRNRSVTRYELHTITTNLDYADWWLLYMLGKNIHPRIYSELVIDLAKRLDDPDGTLKR